MAKQNPMGHGFSCPEEIVPYRTENSSLMISTVLSTSIWPPSGPMMLLCGIGRIMPGGLGPLGRQVAAEAGHLDDERLRRWRPGFDANSIFAIEFKRIGADNQIAEPDDVDLHRIRRAGILLQLLVALDDPVMPVLGHEGDAGMRRPGPFRPAP